MFVIEVGHIRWALQTVQTSVLMLEKETQSLPRMPHPQYEPDDCPYRERGIFVAIYILCQGNSISITYYLVMLKLFHLLYVLYSDEWNKI